MDSLKSQAMADKKDATPFWALINYASNQDAMNYAEYRAQGLLIGSGAIESAQNRHSGGLAAPLKNRAPNWIAVVVFLFTLDQALYSYKIIC